METRVGIIGIIVEDNSSIELLNSLLHDYADFIIGRTGIPYSKRKVNVISIVMDAPVDTINALCGKIGKLNGVSAKAVCQNI